MFVHELGHFFFAKRAGVRVDEFGFGFPPRLFGVRYKETLYSVNLIPLGGFVKIKGEGGEDADASDSFSHKSAWQKILILAAGVIMNIVLAFVLFSVGFMVGSPKDVTGEDLAGAHVSNTQILITAVDNGSPAERAGLTAGDIIISVNDQAFTDPSEIIDFIGSNATEDFLLTYDRGGNLQTQTLKPEQYGSHDKPLLGIAMARIGIVKYGFFKAVYEGFLATIGMTVLVVQAFGGLLISLVKGSGLGGQVSGPVGVAVITGQVAKLGLPYLINFTAMLSINLAILNIVPFPALDGGRILFVVLEKLKGKPISERFQTAIHNAGFGLLLLLIVVVTYQDIVRYGKQILDSLTSLFT